MSSARQAARHFHPPKQLQDSFPLRREANHRSTMLRIPRMLPEPNRRLPPKQQRDLLPPRRETKRLGRVSAAERSRCRPLHRPKTLVALITSWPRHATVSLAARLPATAIRSPPETPPIPSALISPPWRNTTHPICLRAALKQSSRAPSRRIAKCLPQLRSTRSINPPEILPKTVAGQRQVLIHSVCPNRNRNQNSTNRNPANPHRNCLRFHRSRNCRQLHLAHQPLRRPHRTACTPRRRLLSARLQPRRLRGRISRLAPVGHRRLPARHRRRQPRLQGERHRQYLRQCPRVHRAPYRPAGHPWLTAFRRTSAHHPHRLRKLPGVSRLGPVRRPRPSVAAPPRRRQDHPTAPRRFHHLKRFFRRIRAPASRPSARRRLSVNQRPALSLTGRSASPVTPPTPPTRRPYCPAS